jgi:predicted nuclease of predicted toxin-antitoxin system
VNLFIDESVSQAIVDRLQLDGHSLLVMRQIAPGAPDNEVLKRAVSASSVLLTEDKDFGELVYQSGQAHTGVVLIRLAGLPRQQRASLVSQCIQDREAELPNAFTVISRGGIRIRKSTPPGP